MAQSQGHRPVTPVSGTHVLQGAAVRRWIALAEIVADQTRDLVDVLNVFPVPDADTGTNVLLTLRSASDALHRLGRAADAAQVARAAADGAVRGARGNSGLLISQALAAFADVCAEAPDPTGLRPVELVHVYEAMADTTWAAVSRPVSGTLLSVARDAATAARSALEEATASSPATLSLIAAAAAFGAQESVVETSGLGHGPVDAGGAAFMLLLTCLSDTIDAMQDDGRGATEAPELRQGHEDADEHAPYTAVARQMLTDLAAGGVPHSVGPEPLGMSTGEFEVMYLLEATAVQAGQLRRDLERVGEPSFMAVVTALVTWDTKLGAFTSLILLLLQLASSAGTYPLPLTDKIFQNINPWLPMSYSVSALRQTISITGQVGGQVAFMTVVLLLFVGLGFLVYNPNKKELV